MSTKGLGLVAGIVAVIGAAILIFKKDEISIPGLIYKGEWTIPGTDLVNRSTLSDDVAKTVIDASTDFYDKIKGTGLKNIGDLGDAVKVPEADMEEYIDRLKNFTQPVVTPIKVTQDIIDRYSRTIVEPKANVDDYLDRLKEFAAPVVEPIKVTQDILNRYARSYTVL